jgi:vacuolar-type H+-ATPase subunit F/Vma7
MHHKTLDQDGDDYYYQILLLHVPFRSKQTHLLPSSKTAYETLISKKDQIQLANVHDQFLHDVEKAIDAINNMNVETILPHIASTVAPETSSPLKDIAEQDTLRTVEDFSLPKSPRTYRYHIP